MDFYGATAIQISPATSALKRLICFFGHYDCRVYLTKDAYVDIGAGSLPTFQNLSMIPPGYVGSLGSIGRFTEINANAEIMCVGEHNHDQPVNITFGSIAVLGGSDPHGSFRPTKPVQIGNGVVISSGVRILSGVKVGDGAVIGAGAIVNRDVEDRAIVAGVPARKLRQRAEMLPWWNFDTAYLFSNLADIQRLALPESTGQMWREERPPFVIQVNPDGGLTITGFLDGNKVRSFDQAPVTVQRYLFNNISPEGKPYWVADCWTT